MATDELNLDEQFAEMMADQTPSGNVRDATVVSMEVEITWLGHTTVRGRTRELSDFGVVVEAGFDAPPPHGTILYARLVNEFETGDTPLIKTRVSGVMGASSRTVELEFIFED